MSKFKFTQNQQNAINSTGGSILVSAAAGSGKTAVLVERVIKKLTDKANPIDANKLLIVTFTNAAAAEMKNRINERINLELEAKPKNKALKRQQILLNQAHIGTIDSFCNELIKQNFYKLNVPSNFKIASDGEISIAKSLAMDETLEFIYTNAREKFNDLIGVFNFGKDDSRFISTIEILYSNIISYPFPFKWLKEKLNLLDENKKTAENIYGEFIIDYLKAALEYLENLANENLELLNSSKQAHDAYFANLDDDKDLIENLNKKVKTNNWDEICRCFEDIKFSRLKTVRNCEFQEIKNVILENRKTIKDIINKKLKPLFELSDEENKKDIIKLKKICSQLFLAVEIYYNNLENIKQERNILDFNDLLHKSLELLLEEKDEKIVKTDFAKSLSENFDEILVDEYQDINFAQDMFFRALSKNEENLFTVGDAKQSIYRFRHAKPDIFINRKDKLDLYDKQKNNYPAKIILDKNFRSREEILNAVNLVFSKLMSKKTSNINYTLEDKLTFGADYYKQSRQTRVEFNIIEANEENLEEKTQAEAVCIAEKIIDFMSKEKLVQKGDELKKAEFGDFAILLRNTKNKANIFADVFSSYGIPTWVENQKNFFENEEIKTVVSLIRVINNPMQDIAMLSVLYSPIYNFTTDEIAKIRAARQSEAIYLAINGYSKNNNALAKKCKNFLSDLEHFRNIYPTMPSNKMIDYLLCKTNYYTFVFAMKDYNEKIANLRLLIDYAKNFENTGFKGLASFIRHIDKIILEGKNLESTSNIPKNLNAVKIISIHKSKGLEFPICFLANCSTEFHNIKDDIIVNSDLGVGLRLFENNKKILYSTLVRDAILLKEKLESTSEELRLLYVAMTRAKEYLIITGTLKNAKEKLNNISLNKNEIIDPYFVLSKRSYIDWLFCVFARQNKIKINVVAPKKLDNSSYKASLATNCQEDLKLINKISDNLNFKYKKDYLKNVPSKLSVTQILENQSAYKHNLNIRPNFIQSESLINLDKGNILHKFMQFANFANAKANLKLELKRLIKLGYLKKDEIDILNQINLKIFFNCTLCEQILNADEIYKEYSFKVMVSPNEINLDENINSNEKCIMLQGIADLVFIKNHQMTIVDYKTDKSENILDIKEKYKKQLKLYALSLNKIFPKIKNITCIIYSFCHNEYVEI